MKRFILYFQFSLLFLLIQSCQGQKVETDIPANPTISIEALQQANSSPSVEKNYNNAITNSIDFRIPAKKVMGSVVHIISTYEGKSIPRGEIEIPEFFKDFFGENFDFFFDSPRGITPMPRMGSGSGVIVTNDGYILTNNHVIRNADKIEIVTHDNRFFDATIVGVDPSTDLALLKIDEKNLPFVKIGNSDKIEVGEWVLAVGNPFNLSTTVTAGIVSAKARNINIIRDQASIESFIQTDAAVNPGNSGGALVNLKGELIGVNTAIASPTGVYAGYSFAIPSNIAKKIIDDLLNYGEVQRAYLGVTIRDLNSNLTEELGLTSTAGVYIDSIVEKSAAEEAGIRKKDVIIKIDNEKVESSPRLQEVISRHRPGDKISVTLLRNGKEKKMEVTLKGKTGEEKISRKERKEILKDLGIEVSNLTKSEIEKAGIKGGVKITNVYPGKIRRNTGIRKGFVITKVNNELVSSVDEFLKNLEETSGGVMLEGIYLNNPNATYYYAFGL